MKAVGQVIAYFMALLGFINLLIGMHQQDTFYVALAAAFFGSACWLRTPGEEDA